MIEKAEQNYFLKAGIILWPTLGRIVKPIGL